MWTIVRAQFRPNEPIGLGSIGSDATRVWSVSMETVRFMLPKQGPLIWA